ncbi:MAG: NADH-quinone oxidoreductase subunit C, partial [Lentisphaerota bacterium]
MNDAATLSKQLGNAQACPLETIPDLAFARFRRWAASSLGAGQRAAAFFGVEAENDATDLFLVLADDSTNRLEVARTRLEGGAFDSLTPECPQLHLFEREIAEQFGLRPEGHPWLKPVRYRPSWNKSRDAWKRPAGQPIPPAVTDFYRVEGEDIHEVAVGPVHAGIIEPGHFRFQCHGENVFHLEIALGYQ